VVRMTTLAVALTSAAAAALLSCGGPPRRDLTVTAWSPSDAIDGDAPIEVRFDRPVVEDGQVGAAVDPRSVDVTPPVRWTGHWLDRQSFVLEPSEPLRTATRYTVRLRGELARRAGDFSFSFVHAPLVIDGLVGADPQAIDPAAPLAVAFNLPVEPGAAAARCALTGKGARIALTAVDAAGPAMTVRLQPAALLPRDTEYRLACDGLVPAGGELAMAGEAGLDLKVRPPLGVAAMTPSGWEIPADEVAIRIELTSPVALDAIRAAVRAEPPIPGLDAGYLDGSGRIYTAVADLETTTEYRLEVAGLVDVHGDRLAEPASHAFRTGDARPRISMERGLYALEASARGYPVWTRNLPTYQIACAGIPRAKLVELVTTQMNYDPWGGYDDRAAIDWQALRVTPRRLDRAVPGAKNKWQLDQLDLGATCGAATGARGVYLAEVASQAIADDPDRPWWSPARNRVMVNVTDLGVLLKVGPASGVAWVTSLATGQPVAGARVIVYTPQGKQVWVDVTDRHGLVKLPGSAKLLEQPSVDDTADLEEPEWGDWDSYRSQRLIAVVEKGQDLAIVDGNWANGIQTWNFGVPEERRGGVTQVRGFIQSDRGLYRPGETVHFKGIVREITAGAPPRVPRRQPVAVEVSDSRGATVHSGQAPLSAFGGFSFDLPIAAEAAVGDWYVTAKVGNRVFRERFHVEEFRPATFEVKLTGGERHTRLGERLRMTVDAAYLFGAPLAGAAVRWNVSRRQHWLRFPGHAEYTFEDNGSRWWWYGERERYGELVSDGEGTTDARGQLGFVVRDPDASLRGPQDYVVTATVTDEADQAMSASRVITAHHSDLYLGMHTQELVQAAGMPFAINLVAVSPAGKRVAAPATLTVVRRVTDCRWETVAMRSYSRCTTREEVAVERKVTVPASGTLTERIYPKKPGDYLIRIAGQDGRGNAVAASSMVWVIGKGEAFWSGDEAARMTLIASKRRYQPGDTARLVAQANLVRPTALVTIERDGVVHAEVRRLDSAAEGIELTIRDTWGPNVFASVAMVSGRQGTGDRNRPQFKMGIVELTVDSEHKRLAVEVKLDQPSVRPGAPVSGQVVVTRDGKPVRAELSLSAADEGVLQLIAYQTPDPMKTFYASWGLGVDAGTNWNRLARLADPEDGDPDEGGDFGGGDGAKIRSRFVSSAYWAPALLTDERGVARFRFAAPDNLTAFRLMAVAADAGDGFGSGEVRLVVDKPLMATPVLPRFVGAGDRLSVGVLIHNHTGKPGTAQVTAKADGLVLTDARQEIAIPAGGSARVRFGATASQNAAATFEASVAMNGERDALRVTVPIRRPRVIDVATLGQDAGSGAHTALAIRPGRGVLAAESELVVSVDRTGLGDLEPSLRYLVEYPYGCLEQTLSRFIPLAKAKDLAGSLGLQGLAGTKLDAFLRAGVAKVARHQRGDGHFSLWPQSPTHPHLTVYALWGLTEARRAGATVPPETMTRGLAVLQRWLNAPGTIAPSNQGATAAMAAWVLAENGQADAGAMQRLYELRARLPRWGQGFLLRAMIAGKSAEALIADVERELLGALEVTDGKARLTDHRHADDHYYMTSPVRATGIVLSALVARDPAHPRVPELVAGLKDLRRGDGRWSNTQDNLWALIALSDYARHAAQGTGWVTIRAGERQLARKKLSGAEVVVVRTPLDRLGAGAVTIAADRGVHWTARLVSARVDDGAAAARGYTVTREYLDERGAPLRGAKAGDIVTVRLTVVADAAREWIALVDPLPAGLEPLNPNLVAAGDAATSTTSTTRGWSPPVWDHTELRDDRVLWFSDRVRAGTHVMTYKARATIDGTFTVPPASIEAMYEPEVRGRTASTTFTVSR
jgi:alpha-2-macroglobulin